MTSKERKRKEQYICKEKKLEKKHYRIIIGLMIAGCCYQFFLSPEIIGHNEKVPFFLFWLPVTLGMTVLGFYRKEFLLTQYSRVKGFWLSAFVIGFYLLQGILFSYLSLGQLTQVTWDLANLYIADQNPIITVKCDVTRFWTGKNPSIDFDLKDKHERFNVSYSTIKEFKDKDPDQYRIHIQAQKGIWDHYIVKGWEIIKKDE